MDILMLGYICIHLLASANVWLCCQFSYIFVECQKLSVFLQGRKWQWTLKSNRTFFHLDAFLLFLGKFCNWEQCNMSPYQNTTVISSTEASGRSKQYSSSHFFRSNSQHWREWEKVSVESCFGQLWFWPKDEGQFWKVVCAPEFNLPPLSKSRKIKWYLFLLIIVSSKQ